VRVAVIADVHGNAPALAAVLAEIAREQVDAIVDCGDVAAGPSPEESLTLLAAVDLPVHAIMGNADRELLGTFPQLAGRTATVVLDVDGLGPTRFCHGTPRSDEEIVTRATPAERLSPILARVVEGVIVGGHTHVQLDRVFGGHRLVNPGSVGMPYEQEPGAYWAILGPDVELRRTRYAGDDAALVASPDEVVAEFEARAIATPYARLGGHAFFARLVGRFYAGVADDPVLRPLYPGADLGPAEDRLRGFLEQYWGGPTTYSDERGHPRLRMRHATFPIDQLARDRWLAHALAALDAEDVEPDLDAALRGYLVSAADALVNRG
jgi:hemoglobin